MLAFSSPRFQKPIYNAYPFCTNGSSPARRDLYIRQTVSCNQVRTMQGRRGLNFFQLRTEISQNPEYPDKVFLFLLLLLLLLQSLVFFYGPKCRCRERETKANGKSDNPTHNTHFTPFKKIGFSQSRDEAERPHRVSLCTPHARSRRRSTHTHIRASLLRVASDIQHSLDHSLVAQEASARSSVHTLHSLFLSEQRIGYRH